MDVDATRELVLTYFRSWPQQDFDRMRACLADDVDFDAGSIRYRDADSLIRACLDGPRWDDVTLLESIVEPGRAALLYEGRDATTGARMRVAEFLTFDDGKIARIRASIVAVG